MSKPIKHRKIPSDLDIKAAGARHLAGACQEDLNELEESIKTLPGFSTVERKDFSKLVKVVGNIFKILKTL